MNLDLGSVFLSSHFWISSTLIEILIVETIFFCSYILKFLKELVDN